MRSLTLEASVDANTNLVLQLLAVRCRKLAALNLTRSKFRPDLLRDLCQAASATLTDLKISRHGY
jgi:hypothetical protein